MRNDSFKRIITSLALGFWMLVLTQPDLLPSISELVKQIRPAANPAFFSCFAGAMALMYIAVLISIRFADRDPARQEPCPVAEFSAQSV